MSDEHRAPDGWPGTEPAKGTRRAHIRDAVWEAIKGWTINPGDNPHGTTGKDALVIADAVEAALLKIDIGADPAGGGLHQPPKQ